MQWSEFQTVIMLMHMCFIYYLFMNGYDGLEEDLAMDKMAIMLMSVLVLSWLMVWLSLVWIPVQLAGVLPLEGP